MASFSPQFFSSLIPIKNKNSALSSQPKYFLSFRISSSKAESSPNFHENSPESQPQEQDPVKLAFAKAKAYRSSIQSVDQTPNIAQNPIQEPYEVSGKSDDCPVSDEVRDGDAKEEVPLAVKIALEKAKEYKKSKALAENEGIVAKTVQDSVRPSDMEGKNDDGKKEISLAVKIALEKAKEYKKSKGVSGDAEGVGHSQTSASGLKRGNEKSPGYKQSIKNSGQKDELTISSIDFMGLDFADKRSGRGLPAGLVPLSDPFSEGELPEVEILVGDMRKFVDTSAEPKTNQVKENDANLYKPKVSTWGVFPRPNDISKTYGGGRNIRPGEALETAEERATKEVRTRQLLAAYKSKIGLKIDPKLKLECEKALKDGDSLMDLGKLKEALPFYEGVMEKLAFQNELHGLAALQWSICQDSLSRPNEARMMYEKLQSHPSPQVSKKARQFFFSFQAIEVMKVTSLARSARTTGYQNYFDAFVQDKTNYPQKEAEVDDDGLNQSLPYVIFLVSPILMVLLIAAIRFQ